MLPVDSSNKMDGFDQGIKGKKVISVIGLGYVGLVTALGFALKGHKIIGVDINEEKVRSLNRKVSPIYERGIEEALANSELEATGDYRQILPSDITFICVETPPNEDGSISLVSIRKGARQMAEVLKDKQGYHLIVVKSTVVPTTTEEVIMPRCPIPPIRNASYRFQSRALVLQCQGKLC